ncbi:hypothetical protein B6A27_01005 [Anoxybacillus sp. UARK-01]|uniref:hypothetical protein n=1 Tax=Anoxybacillaceae TaxID=3120669 RepID=UPI0009BB8AF5|nr:MULTISPECIES: hypothetical protein [Anoxybacillus]MBB3907732.1 hypothetical protein [Anoxybacillus rupiensis]OQM47363.1 hypothetical protein B6A27_01005 [Anoxybacillus sp. UARK-01]
MFKKGYLSIFSLVTGLAFFSTNTFATTDIVDNDALSNAPGFSEQKGNWIYKTGSGYYNDYRIVSATVNGFDPDYAYIWRFYAHDKNAAHYVYLNNKDFTNPRTAYQIDELGGIVYINQNTAPGGWNFLKTNKEWNHMIVINTSLTTKVGNVGADATKITY